MTYLQQLYQRRDKLQAKIDAIIDADPGFKYLLDKEEYDSKIKDYMDALKANQELIDAEIARNPWFRRVQVG